jgi:hypothetical protein
MAEFAAVFGRPLIGTDDVVLPEVDSAAKPIVVPITGLKWRTAHKLLGGFKIASVKGKN